MQSEMLWIVYVQLLSVRLASFGACSISSHTLHGKKLAWHANAGGLTTAARGILQLVFE
jgi:hypothetical protein